ncbi:Amino acid adenylation domain-containing protein [Sulfidibacter corallicola]|uniref:Amino acid adenylation domain-containing protein n=1 Tax=Sulfidibacter corallicola TaxID=2818388 RepID=A0A8A4TEJ2_SULCO|nr:non-ribosomal peptide synthetase [Sulfidibacter corallicola]QTD48376.1 amino acid adenylation domain-containing protein [Sulfidibacter corallicola]
MNVIEGHRLSPQQARLWRLNQDFGPLAAHLAIGIAGPLEANVLRRALAEVLRRHESTRTSLPGVAGRKLPLQVVGDAPTCTWREWVARPGETEAQAIARMVAEPLEVDLARESGLHADRLVWDENRQVLVLRMPAIHTDYQSLANLFEELGAILAGEALIDEEELTQYLDFSEWLHEVSEDEDAESGKAFWERQQLARLPSLTLPEEGAGGPGFEDDVLVFSLPRETHLTFDTETLSAAWYAFLCRRLDSDDLALHHYFHGRVDEELAGGIGPFASMLALYVSGARQLPFGTFAQTYLAHLRDAETLAVHQPWEAILAQAPGFDFEHYALPGARRCGEFKLTCLDARVHHGPFKLKLGVVEKADGPSLRLHYDRTRFSALAAERLVDSFGDFLASLQRERPADHAAIGGTCQRRQLAEIFGRAEWTESSDLTLDTWFERQVARDPNAPAVVDGEVSWTFADLNRRANQLAHYLVELGAGPEWAIPVCLGRDANLVATLLAVLKTGAAYIGVDPLYPKERVAHMVAGARIALTSPDYIELFPERDGPELTLLDPSLTIVADRPATNPGRRFSPQHPAYIIFTSGSTGRPKGVVITHANVVNYTEWSIANYGLDRRLGAPFHSSVGFDLTVTSMFPPLLSGKAVVMVPDEAGIDGLNDLLRNQPDFSLTKLTPSHLKLLSLWGTLSRHKTTASLVVGGEALFAEDLVAFREGAPELEVFNEYGPTEATVGCCVYQVAGEIEGPIPIGTPIANTRIYVLDEALNPVGFHQTGELYVAGAGLARCYRDQPGMTADRFLPDPFGDRPGERMYRTGDLVRFTGEDRVRLIYVGRNDSQVKIRGFRVEMGEIEATLKKLEDLEEVVVRTHEDEDGTRLVAYYVARETHTTEDLRTFLETYLPDYMVPAVFIPMNRFPLTVNGKIDVDALPDPSEHRPDLANDFVAPRNELETELAEVWQTVLGLERIGIHDNFFALGGDSIRSVRIAAEAKTRGLSITVQMLFAAPTIAELARALEEAPGEREEAVAPGEYRRTEPFELIGEADRALMPADVEDAYPLSAVQLGMLFHMQATKDSPSPPDYHNLNTFEIQVPFHLEPFQRAVDVVCLRHPILRTSFDLTRYSEPMQLVHRDARLEVAWEDLRGYDAAEQKRLVADFIQRENFALMDIQVAPLVALTIQQTEDDRIWLHYKEPHSIADGWSTNFNLVEIFENYLALLEDRPMPERAPLTVTYRDFIHMERSAHRDEGIRDFWRRLLADAEPLALPPLQVDDQNKALADHKHYAELSDTVMAGLTRVSQNLGVPFKSILLAAHVKVMSLFCGVEDITTGLVFNGRPEVPGGDEVRGLFLNTLPIPFKVETGSWSDLILSVFRRETEVLPNRRFPVSALQAVTGRKHEVHAAFSMHHFHSATDLLNSGELQVTGAEDWSKTNYDMAVFFHRSEKDARHMHLVVEGNLDRLSKSQMLRVVNYFQEVLTCIAEEGDKPGRLHHRRTFLPEHERELMTRDWNRTAQTWETPNGLHQLVERAVDAHGHDVAVVFEGQTLTYAELERHANRLAHHLCDLGVEPEARVGLALHRSPEMVISMLAVMKCGAAYVPIDPDYPADRIQYMLDDAAPALCITTAAIRDALEPKGSVPLLVLDQPETRAAVEQVSDRRLDLAIDGEQAAYMIYTSGSTGRPKGAINRHGSIVNRILWMRDYLGTGADDRILQKTPFSFDVSLWEFFLPLICGARLVFARPGGHKDNQYLAELIAAQGVTTMHFVPSMLRHFLADPALPPLENLRNVVCSGEALPPELVTEFRAKLDARLFNLYGPTEAAVDVTAFDCADRDLGDSVPIGRPIANTQVYLLDRDGNLLPPGTPGELFIGGANLARGYHDRPALTAERFVPDPFSNTPGARLYRTGDQARSTPDGELIFLGRKDFQVKFRGFRIELGEIEHALNGHDAVKTSVVTVYEVEPGVERLVAYLVPTEGETADRDALVAQLRPYLRQSLPDYMVPTSFVLLEALPLSANGKLDRRALPAPDGLAAQVKTEYVAPRNELERELAAVWASVLHRETVGVDDNFFDLGGDSILSILIVAKANERGVQITSTQIFQEQTVARLALVAKRGDAAVREQGPVTGEAPLTPIQTWFFEKDFTDRHHWNQSVFLATDQPLRADLLEATAEVLLRHHDALRARFVEENGTLVQRYATPGTLQAYHRVDLAELSGDLTEALEAEAQAWQARFDLAEGSLFKLVHFDLGADRGQRLLILAHHLVVDGLSWRLLLQDLETVYSQLVAGQEPRLPAKTTSFKSWAERLQAHVAETDLDAEFAYWSAAARAEVAALPRDIEADGARNRHGETDSVRMTLGTESTRALLEEVPAAYRTQINDALLCALGRTLASWTEGRRVLIDTEGHGREAPFTDQDVSRTVGWFTAIYPVLLDMGVNDEIGDQLKSIKEQLRAVPHHGLHYGLLRHTSPDRDRRRTLADLPAAEVLFNYLGQFDGVLQSDSHFKGAPESRGHQFSPRGERAHLLDIDCKVMGGQLTVAWTYSTAHHRRATIDRLARRFLEELERLIEHCTAEDAGGFTPSDFPEVDLSSAELDELVAEYGSFEE